jgi:SAM-dependent methyltransferase
VQRTWRFDSDYTQRYTKVRQEFTKEFLADFRKQEPLESAADVGCGVGHFSQFLSELGLQVVAMDGRQENVDEGARRCPGITFLVRDVEDQTLPQVGTFDLVLCFGLLYHLENPFRAIRNLYSMTAKVLLVEAMCVPGKESSLELMDEYQVEDQALNYVAFYPTESCIIKMLYRAGFPFVYRFRVLPANEHLKTTLWKRKARTILVASKVELAVRNLMLAKEPVRIVPGRWDPWMTPLSKVRAYLDWKLWAANMFNVRVLAADWVRKLRGGLGLSAGGRGHLSGNEDRQQCSRVEK